MKNINNNPNAFQHKRQGQDTKKSNQLKTIFNYLQNHIATNTMVSVATGIPQKNICRYKRDLEQLGSLAEVKKSYCKITKHLAWYITTNANSFSKPNQYKLF